MLSGLGFKRPFAVSFCPWPALPTLVLPIQNASKHHYTCIVGETLSLARAYHCKALLDRFSPLRPSRPSLSQMTCFHQPGIVESKRGFIHTKKLPSISMYLHHCLLDGYRCPYGARGFQSSRTTPYSSPEQPDGKVIDGRLRLPLNKSSDSGGALKSRVKSLKRLSLESYQQSAPQSRKRMLQGSQKVVTLALLSNTTMFFAKLYAAYKSGSHSMFSEALHSFADLVNETLLMIGIHRSLRVADSKHPYGFSQERYAWSLISGVGIFFLGGGISLYHGISGLLAYSASSHPMVLGDATTAGWVLGGSLIFELVTMSYAYHHISTSAAARSLPVLSYLRQGADPTTVQVFAEDCAAVTGIVIAAASLFASRYLALPWLDAVGSIGIGALLSSVAIFLVRRNVTSLVETSMPVQSEREIVELLELDPIVTSVHDVKSTCLGPDWVRFKCEILFDGRQVTKRYLQAHPDLLREQLPILQNINTEEELEKFLLRHGEGVILALGSEVDRLEIRIKSKRPEVKHIDLEIL